MNRAERCLLDSSPFRELDASRNWMEQGIWPADWITLENPPEKPCQLFFRLKFSTQEGDAFLIHVAADEKYRLFLDDDLIGFGSERGSIDQWHFDSYRLKLSTGEHTLIAQVFAHGAAGLRSQMTLQPGFLLASEPNNLCTGRAAWESLQVFGLEYTDTFPHAFFSIGKSTVQDGDKIHDSFAQGEKEGWKKVRTLHAGSTAGVRNRYPAFHLLTPATLPTSAREIFRGGKVVFCSSTFSQPLNPADQLADEALKWSELWASGGEWSLPPHQQRRIIIDLEDYVCAWPRVKLSASPGSKVSLDWTESLFIDEKQQNKGNRNEYLGKYFIGIGDEFHAPKDGPMSFEGPFIRTGRYLEIRITTGEHPLTLGVPELLRAEYPLEITSCFEASGFPATPLVERCQRTLRASCHDAIIDGPFYEQMAWLGDTAQVAAVLFSASRDDRPLKKNIDLFDSSRLPDGNLRARWPARDSAYVSAYPMYFSVLLHSHLWWRNDPAYLKTKLNGQRATLNYYLGLVGEDGLLKLTTGWCFADWVKGWDSGIPPMEQDGTCGLFQWQLIWALSCAATVEDTIGEPEMAQFHRRRAKELAQAAEVFWNERKGCFADTREQSSFSEHTQAYAVMSGVLDSDRRDKMRASFARDEKLTKATAAFAHYLYEAYFILGLREKIVEGLRACDDYEKLGLLTTPESPEPTRSDCHGWSAVPHFHFFASLLGIRPTAPFFRKVRIDPMWKLLGDIQATLPHPDGEITVRLSFVDGKAQGEIVLPPGVSGNLICPGKALPLHAGTNLVNCL